MLTLHSKSKVKKLNQQLKHLWSFLQVRNASVSTSSSDPLSYSEPYFQKKITKYQIKNFWPTQPQPIFVCPEQLPATVRWRILAIYDILTPEADLQYFHIPICLCKCANSSCMPLRNLYGLRTCAAELPLCSLFICHLTDSFSLCSCVWVLDKFWLSLTSLASLCAGRKWERHRWKTFLCWPCAGYRLSLFLISRDYRAGACLLICDKNRKSLSGKKK